MNLQGLQKYSEKCSLAQRGNEQGNFMIQACEDLLSFGLVCAFSPGRGVYCVPDLGHKGLALQQPTKYNLHS